MSAQPTTDTLSTRQRIMNEAENLLLTRGFNGFSYQHIAKQLDVKPAAIHYHYPSKEALGTAIISRQLGRLRKWRNLPRVTELLPAAQWEALLDVYRWHAHTDQRVCLFGSLAADFRTLPEAMQQELRIFNRELTEWLAAVLTAGRANNTLHFRGEPLGKAAQLITTLVGALQVARVHDESQFQAVLEQVRLELLNE